MRADAYGGVKEGGVRAKVGTTQNLLNLSSLSLFLVALVFSSPVSFLSSA